MNKHEKLYTIKNEIENKIRNHKLFKLQRDKAIRLVIRKTSMWYSVINASDERDFLSRLTKIPKEFMDEIKFLQESMKWLIRWCVLYCPKESMCSDKVVADEVLDLLTVAYYYEDFYRFWFLHNKHRVSYQLDERTIQFNFNKEENHKLYSCYNAWRIGKQEEDKFNSISGREDFQEMMYEIHMGDFEFQENIQFEGFSLEDYEKFSVSINNFIVKDIEKSINNNITKIYEGKNVYEKSREEWIKIVQMYSKMDRSIIMSILDFFTLDFDNIKNDISLNYFVPIHNKLILMQEIFMTTRPAINAIRLLAKMNQKSYSKAQNYFEKLERDQIYKNLGDKYSISYGRDKKKAIRPGMDLLVYDPRKNYLHVIELKYKIPVESIEDVIQLEDGLLEKGYTQLEIAKEYVETNKDNILQEYFGDTYSDVKPLKVDHIILTNYSIGTGYNLPLDTPIFTIEHYIELMNELGVDGIGKVLKEGRRGFTKNIERIDKCISLCDYKLVVPEYGFSIN